MNYQEILLDCQAPRAIITLNKPEKVNALSVAMIGEITHALQSISNDEAIKVIIIRAAGKHFCAGHYLKELVDQDMKEYQSIFDNCNRMMSIIHRIPQPVIAQVQGVATAAGCQLVAWCDMAVAETGAKFATPGVTIGLFCSTPAVAVGRAIGRKAAMEMLLTGRFFSADEAKQLGLVNRVVPAETLAEETEKLADQVAQASRLVLSIGKQTFYNQIDQSDDQAMAYAGRTMAMNLATEDAQVGIKAFMAKEKPVWKNR